MNDSKSVPSALTVDQIVSDDARAHVEAFLESGDERRAFLSDSYDFHDGIVRGLFDYAGSELNLSIFKQRTDPQVPEYVAGLVHPPRSSKFLKQSYERANARYSLSSGEDF